MKLEQIDKSRYDKHFKLLFLMIVVVMLAIALLSSTLLIHLLGNPGQEGNFIFNLFGVVIAAVFIGSMLRRYHKHPFMYELVYVWQLKKQLNQIQRKKQSLLNAVKDDQLDAIIAMYFFYHGSKQLYELDNNTITMEELNSDLATLDTRIAQLNLSVTTDMYTEKLLTQF